MSGLIEQEKHWYDDLIEGDYGFDEMNEVRCPVCRFYPAMYYIGRCWTCGHNGLVFCPRCRRITCLRAQQKADTGGIR